MSWGRPTRRSAPRVFGKSNLRSGGESLEPRWTPAWGSVAPSSITVPTNAAQVTLANNDASGTASITANEVDYYSFVAGASGAYRFATSTPSSNLDTVVGLYSSTGGRVGYNDDISTSNADSQVSLNLVAGQRYYLGVTNYTGTAGGSYSWVIDGPATTTATDDSYEENDTRTAARDLGTLTGATTINNLKMADLHDYYKFTMSGTGTSADYVQISFLHSQGDLDLEILNSAGTRVGIDQGTTNSERVNLTNLAAGTYYVHVYGYNGARNPNYSLTIDPAAASTPPAQTRDLTGASLSVTSSNTWGQTITVAAAARNLGNTASGAFTGQFYLSRDANGSSDDVLLLVNGTSSGNVAFASINGGATGTAANTTLRLPSALPTGWSGSTFYVVMKLDTGNVVAETNEINNFSQAGQFTIVGGQPAGNFNITLNITGMNSAQQEIFRNAAARWEQIITGDLPSATYNGVTVDDILIEASGAAIDGTGGILGQAGPDRLRSGSSLPYHGVMEFDSADLASMQSGGSLFSVIFHEMGHVLGVGTIWGNKGLLTGAGTSNPRFTGAQATAAYNQIFGRNESGVPVENTGGGGTRDAHWRESVFNNEIMTGWINSGSNPISRVTVASMADLGYTVNMSAADLYTPPSGGALQSGSTGSSSAAVQAASVDLWMSQLGSGQQQAPAQDDVELLPLGWQ